MRLDSVFAAAPAAAGCGASGRGGVLYFAAMNVFCRIFALSVPLLLAGVAVAAQPGESAAAKATHCIGCHNIPGYRSVFPEVYPVPKIIGQSAAYLETALRAYRDGSRTHPSMTAIAAQLSDEDIKILAEWYAGGAE